MPTHPPLHRCRLLHPVRLARWALLAWALLALPTPAGAQALVRRFPPPVRAAPAAAELPGLGPWSAPGAPALAGVNESWDVLVARARVGRKVKVLLEDSTAVQGRLMAIDSKSITVEQVGGPRVLPAGEVARVQYATHHSRNAFWAGVGGWAALGLVAGLTATPQDPDAAVMLAVVLGLPTGGLLSAIFRDAPLYDAPPVKAAP